MANGRIDFGGKLVAAFPVDFVKSRLEDGLPLNNDMLPQAKAHTNPPPLSKIYTHV